ncbi:hypothetical protein SIN8267_00115 [Sinobacterium norvegicum]|uniref:DNA recombination protein RmuC n=1 Tax=Sinobacterium norvegicum TaxID=1641715 RepID=A0ABM9AAK5_9GAMM|nr:hypothetical protein [Sinobacterium norvegicum]CAH0990032.1 hypothetical protein SIN8267_00115 [Sinobacterium norvegicum]
MKAEPLAVGLIDSLLIEPLASYPLLLLVMAAVVVTLLVWWFDGSQERSEQKQLLKQIQQQQQQLNQLNQQASEQQQELDQLIAIMQRRFSRLNHRDYQLISGNRLEAVTEPGLEHYPVLNALTADVGAGATVVEGDGEGERADINHGRLADQAAELEHLKTLYRVELPKAKQRLRQSRGDITALQCTIAALEARHAGIDGRAAKR